MSNSMKVLLLAGVCFATGTALGILFAPDEGAETRRKLRKQRKKLVNALNDTLEDGKDSLHDLRKSLQGELDRVNKKLADAVH